MSRLLRKQLRLSAQRFILGRKKACKNALIIVNAFPRNIAQQRNYYTKELSRTINPEISENIYLQTVSSSAYMRSWYAGSSQLMSTKKVSPLRFTNYKKALAVMLISVGLYGLLHIALPGNTTSLNPVDAQTVSTNKTVDDKSSEPSSHVQTDIETVATTLTGFGLIIPSIGVEASMETVGLKNDGSLDTPRDYSSTGWYNGSPYPGQKGPSVIVGHVDSKSGPAVFWKLPTLSSGSLVIIQNDDGSMTTFEVERLEQYSQSNFPTDSVYGDIEYSGLRLITCSGSFNRSTGRYSHNTVVYARKI